MSVTNFVVSSLPDYVQQNRDLLINRVAIAGPTIDRMAKQTGIKDSAALNFLEVTPVLQNGAGCGYTRGGTAELTQRTIKVGVIKIDLPICAEQLRGKWAEWKIRTNAGEQDLPFEEELLNEISDWIREQIEKAIWMGDTTSLDPNLANFDGLIKIALNEADVVDVNIASGASMMQAVAAMLPKIPAKARKRGARIHVAPELFEAYLLELVNANMFHYSGPQDDDPVEWVIPGTNVRIVKTEGLAGTKYLFASWDRNLYYGTDRESDQEDFRVHYDVKDEIFDILAKFAAGVQIAFPADVALGVMAAAPVSPDGQNAELHAIAEDIDQLAGDVSAMKTDLNTVANKSAGLDNLAGMKTDLDGIKTAAEALDDLAGAFDTDNDAIKTLAVTPQA